MLGALCLLPAASSPHDSTHCHKAGAEEEEGGGFRNRSNLKRQLAHEVIAIIGQVGEGPDAICREHTRFGPGVLSERDASYDPFPLRLRVPIPPPTRPVPKRSKVVGSGMGVKGSEKTLERFSRKKPLVARGSRSLSWTSNTNVRPKLSTLSGIINDMVLRGRDAL